MWALGLLAGLLMGAVVGGFDGAFLGAIAGAVAGGYFGSLIKKDDSAAASTQVAGQIVQLQRAISDMQTRLLRLENQRSAMAPPMMAPAAPTADAVASEPAAAPAAEKVRPVVERREEIAAPIEAVKAVAVADVGPAPVSHAIEAPPAEQPNFLVRWFTGGNTVVRAGAVILFIGVGFLVKFAAEHALFPVELRLAMSAAGAIALLVTGWRLREKRSDYALTLQGAGIGLLYLTTFGAYRIWHLLPPGLAFGLLAAVAVLSAILAIRQDSLALAMTGVTGGFLAPILASTGTDSHVALFSYYALLNTGIFVVAWQKAWRPLNLLGFAFTFVVGFFWGARFYRPEVFASTEPFLILFFLGYVAIAVLYAWRRAPLLTHYVDGTLIFGVPIVAFGMQAGLVREFEDGLSLSSLALAAFYLSLAKWLHSRRRDELHLLVESFLALGVIFATLTLPLALDASWTSAAWAVEGAGVYWIGKRQGRQLACLFGALLQGLAAAAFLHGWHRPVSDIPVVNAHCLGAVLIAAAGLVVHRMMRRVEPVAGDWERGLAPLFFLWSLLWWLFAGLVDIERFLPHEFVWTATLAFFTVTVAVSSVASLRLQWTEASWPFFAFLPAMMVLALLAAADQQHPLANFGWAIWPIAFGWYCVLLKAFDDRATGDVSVALHAGAVWFLAAFGAWELRWATREFELRHSAWSAAAWALVPALVIGWAASRRAASRWPVAAHARAYLVHASVPLAIFLWIWSLGVNITQDGQSAPLPYLPLLNAIDLMHGFILLVALRWRMRSRDAGIGFDPFASSPARMAVLVASFVWLNSILLRSLHHWADIPYQLPALMHSVLVQTSLSIFWTLLALATMLFGTRRGERSAWMLGAALMAVVVVKLLLVDLSHAGSVMRIVSFIVVGVPMLVMGYVAPVPPAQEKAEGSA
ncbi:MAG: DUF2339 domain-containing protein [Betaproteobacteria bacterium]|nr:DUF2339 domain-containing protein [Betaproteobacteria bacterium]